MNVFILPVEGNKNYLPILSPNLSVKIKDEQPFLKRAVEQIKNPIFNITPNIEEASFLLIPYDYFYIDQNKDYLKKVQELSIKHNKKVLIFDYSDFDDDINVKNSLIFRTSKYKSKMKENEFIIPLLIEDLGRDRELIFRDKSDKLVIGFAGWAHLSTKQYIKSFIKELPIRFLSIFNKHYRVYIRGVFWRMKTNKILENSNLVSTNFLIRKSYSAHKDTAEKDPLTLREEFIENIINSDYALIVRGDANAATRFYEAISLGRIPLILDTDLVFPFEDIINYKEFCVFVDFTDINRIDQIIRDFHDQITNSQFREMQKKAREVFVEYFRVDIMAKHLINILRKEIS